MAHQSKSQSRQWLKRLHIQDQAAALRWIKEIGELRFLRIAAAAQNDRRPGRPKEKHSEGIRLALWLYVTKQASKDDAPGMAAQQMHDSAKWEGADKVTVNHLQRVYRKGMEEASQALIDKLVQKANEEKRETIFSRSVADNRDASTELLKERMSSILGLSSVHTARLNRPPPVSLEERERLARIRNVMSFFKAFPDLFDDEMPMSQISTLYRETYQALSEVMKPQT